MPGRNLNHELVRLGYAWWFRRFSDDQTLAKLEADAHKNKRGLWAGAIPMAPWDWREMQRSKGRQPTLKVKVVPNGMEIVALLPNPEGRDQGNEQVMIANSNEDAVDLEGWKLKDRASHVYMLSGNVPGKGKLRITMAEPTMPLNNDGDEVLLIDGGGRGAESRRLREVRGEIRAMDRVWRRRIRSGRQRGRQER